MSVLLRTTKASKLQIKKIVQFYESHPYLSNPQLTPLFSPADKKRLWQELTSKLNAMGGAEKTAIKWQKTWTDFKSQVKRKAAAEAKRTDEQLSEAHPLTPLEQRVLLLINNDMMSVVKDELDTSPELLDPLLESEPLQPEPSTSAASHFVMDIPHSSTGGQPITRSPRRLNAAKRRNGLLLPTEKVKNKTNLLEGFLNELKALNATSRERLEVEKERLTVAKTNSDTLELQLHILTDIRNQLQKNKLHC